MGKRWVGGRTYPGINHVDGSVGEVVLVVDAFEVVLVVPGGAFHSCPTSSSSSSSSVLGG